MIIFNSDLDNTLIYSKRRDITEDKICVEMKKQEEVSFMTCLSYDLLRQVREKLCFVPTTTRSTEQYQRIHLGEKKPEYALVCNGGILLAGGVRDEMWYRESLELAAAVSHELETASALLKRDKNRSFEVIDLDGLFLFTKTEQPMESLKKLTENLDSEKVEVFHIGQKIYVLPKTLSKGAAVLRLKKRLGADWVVAAGDSLMDVSMLCAADRAILPMNLAEQIQIKNHMTVWEGRRTFSDEVLESVLNELTKIR